MPFLTCVDAAVPTKLQVSSTSLYCCHCLDLFLSSPREHNYKMAIRNRHFRVIYKVYTRG